MLISIFLGLWDAFEFCPPKKIATTPFTPICLGANPGTDGLVPGIKLRRIRDVELTFCS